MFMLKTDIKEIIRTESAKNFSLLSNIKFELSEGKVYTILGKNGSGKTTLIKSLTKLLDAKTFNVNADVFWYGKNIYKMNDGELQGLRKNQIRYVFQDLTNNFDPLKKLSYYFSKTELELTAVDKLLSDFLLPEFKIISGLYPYELSGGMAQRLSLILAVIPAPKLIILDEPTSALDYINTNLLKFLFTNHCSKANSVIIVTHDMVFAEAVSDEIAVLKNGTISDFVNKDVFYKTAAAL
ncbi:MAG: ATP-binding cassette domain-containing protein [Ignavibacteriales bacterium]|nr:ABC transporter ATP-binding protein [Ignavibacterium sp.]MDX9711780.1 ATP-binding cassette domain-containing protein [Ignavibacteriaceae bacterium]MEB2355260.1 ATP-binding cassette domain-containing protein [Ignavibacteriales bacterium]GIK21151.1 MAG: ABC transporter ATP-binding protein [Ignavibacteriota bacterium]